MKRWPATIFFCLLLFPNFFLPLGQSSEPIVGQVLLNGRPNTNFKVLLWYNSASESELSLTKKLVSVKIELDGSFRFVSESKDFTILLFPSNQNLSSPAIQYDFEDGKLSNKIVLSNSPRLDYNIKFDENNNAMGQLTITSFVNVNPSPLLNGSTYTFDPNGIEVPLATSSQLPEIWRQEAEAFNEKIARLEKYALNNTQGLSSESHLIYLAKSLSLAKIPTELLYISKIQFNPGNISEAELKVLESELASVSQEILMKNKIFVRRMMSLVSLVYSQIDQSLRSEILSSKRKQQIVWAKPNIKEITLSPKLLNLDIYSTSGLEVEIESHTQNVCSIVNKRIKLESLGLCSIFLLQDGNSDFLPAPPFTINFYVRLPAAKQSTIECVQGKVVKKVTAAKPVCPKGYKKK